jgi:hypothetical protein
MPEEASDVEVARTLLSLVALLDVGSEVLLSLFRAQPHTD